MKRFLLRVAWLMLLLTMFGWLWLLVKMPYPGTIGIPSFLLVVGLTLHRVHFRAEWWVPEHMLRVVMCICILIGVHFLLQFLSFGLQPPTVLSSLPDSLDLWTVAVMLLIQCIGMIAPLFSMM